MAAAVIDTAGEGMFMPLTYLYFLLTTHISVLSIGAGITGATLAALPTGLLAGLVVDRVSPKRMVIANNITSAAGYACYLFVHNLPSLVLAVFIVQVGDRLYWSAWPTLVADLAEPHEVDRLYATMAAARNGSMGVGYMFSGLLLGLSHGLLGAHLIVLANCLSCLIAAVLFGVYRNQRVAERLASHQASRSGMRAIARNKRLIQITSSQSLLALAWLLPGIILPVYLVHYLNMPRWLPSAALSVNLVLTTVLQSNITKFVAPYRRTSIIAMGAAAMASSMLLMAATRAGQSAFIAVGITIGAITLVSIGMMLAGPTTSALAAVIAPVPDRGLFLSIFQQSWAISNTAGPLAIGWLLSVGVGWLWAFMTVALIVGGASFLLSGISLPDAVNRPVRHNVPTERNDQVTNG